MFSRFARFLMVATAFAPILVTVAFVRYVQVGQIDLRTQVYLGLAIALVLTCVLVVEAAKRVLQMLPFTADSIRTADKEVIGFVLSYLLPLTKLSGTATDDRVLAFVFGILVVVVLTTHSYHFNPLLGIMGYHFYEVSTPDKVTFILITRREMRRKADIANVVQLTDYIVMEKP